MRAILAAVLFALPAAAQPYGPILRVIDGDTYVIAASWLPPALGSTLSLRVMGIDTPEHGALAKCAAENALSARATAFARAALARAGNVTVTLVRWDKYGGRVDGVVLVDGLNLGAALIKAGLARPYDGGKKAGWC